ncbi:MAG: lipopolysaccharide kinase InaA family protein [Tepidisphaerales bacterium]
MLETPAHKFRVAPEYHDLLRHLHLDAETVFTDPRIRVWRKLPDRENAFLDAARPDGTPVRLHIKRHAPVRYGHNPADVEAQGIRALLLEGIPTVPLVGWGTLADGRSCVITEDLAGFRAADKMIETGTRFERLLAPTAELAAKLHSRGLHHRDLYLCHFFAKDTEVSVEVRLIDAARVQRLPAWLFRNRWIVKDLSQFWYSAMRLSIPPELRRQWLESYAAARSLKNIDTLQRQIERKAAWIERHDAKLQRAQPTRNISIPGT